ncbi:hypothetical protein ACFCW6_17705 [Streptomyces sp. NPDC056333]|uniref:hypothetical protein n=1 Tax=Streptomyces sp. NPDC056333 TaxID=3345786 RepID=UPI0035D6F7C7
MPGGGTGSDIGAVLALGACSVVVTLDAADGGGIRLPGIAVDVVDTTGAGGDLVTSVRRAVGVGAAAVRCAGAANAWKGSRRDCGHEGSRGGKRSVTGALVESGRRAGTVQP